MNQLIKLTFYEMKGFVDISMLCYLITLIIICTCEAPYIYIYIFNTSHLQNGEQCWQNNTQYLIRFKHANVQLLW